MCMQTYRTGWHVYIPNICILYIKYTLHVHTYTYYHCLCSCQILTILSTLFWFFNKSVIMIAFGWSELNYLFTFFFIIFVLFQFLKKIIHYYFYDQEKIEELKKIKYHLSGMSFSGPPSIDEFITGLSKRYFYLLTVSSTNTKHPEDEDHVS